MVLLVSEDGLWYGRNVEIGDVFFSNWYPINNSWDHAMIITKISGNATSTQSNVFYSTHSNDRYDHRLDWSHSKKKWFSYHRTKGYHIVKTNRGYYIV